jgi:hypothetical protein
VEFFVENVSAEQLNCHVGRVVVIAAQLEQAPATLAYGVLGADDAAYATTHARPVSQLRDLIVPQAETRPNEWWSAKAIALVRTTMDLLNDRHMVVHGYWTDLQGVVDEKQFITFKPERKSVSWHARYFDLSGLATLAEDIESAHQELRVLADELVDEIHAATSP